MTLPTVSIITPTYERPDGLRTCRGSVLMQDYQGIVEQVVVSDGDPSVLTGFVGASGNRPCQFIRLGRNWHSACGGRDYGGIPRQVGGAVAIGDYIGYCDDDSTLYHQHVRVLVDAVEHSKRTWAYSKMRRIWRDTEEPFDELGDGVPRWGQIDMHMILHPAECFTQAQWRPGVGHSTDWIFIRQLLEHYGPPEFVDEVTVDYSLAPRHEWEDPLQEAATVLLEERK